MLVDQGALRWVGNAWELERPIDVMAMPDTVHAVLAARLDTLSSDEKRVSQEAAVVGRVFWDRLVAQLYHEELAPTVELLGNLCGKEDRGLA